MPKKSKFATILISFVPGAGHMYLGWMQRGLVFMLSFILAIFLVEWTRLSLFGLLMPAIWFYSFFDALQCYELPPEQGSPRSDWNFLFQNHYWIGIGLIGIGILILINKLAYPVIQWMLGYESFEMLRISFVALLLIIGGIRLAWGKPLPSATPATPAPPASPSEGAEGGSPEENSSPEGE